MCVCVYVINSWTLKILKMMTSNSRAHTKTFYIDSV